MKSNKNNESLVVAGAGADGHGVISGWRGEGGMTRAELADLATRAGLPVEWLPAPKDASAQLGRAVKAVAQATGMSDRQEKKRNRQVVDTVDWDSRWLLITNDVTEAKVAGGTYGTVALVVTLMTNLAGAAELTFDCESTSLIEQVQTEFDMRVGAERYVASDITNWLTDVHRFRLEAVRYGFGWYVPRVHRAQAEAICSVFWNEARWGECWMDPPLPVATSAQLAMGIANGLIAEVGEVFADLVRQRDILRTKRDDITADIGPRAAENFMVRLTRIGTRVCAYDGILGTAGTAACKESIHDIMVELDNVLEGGVSGDWNGIWERIEAERLANGGSL
jgi:hypothetical protein